MGMAITEALLAHIGLIERLKLLKGMPSKYLTCMTTAVTQREGSVWRDGPAWRLIIFTA